MTSKLFSDNIDLRNRIFFVLFALFVYRVGSHIPIPIVDVENIMNRFSIDNTGIFSLFNLFSGGALSKVTIFSLGVMPYISSSIIIQLLSTVWSPLKNIKKDGKLGQKKISSYTRYLTVVLATFQAIGMSKFMISMSSLENIIFFHYFIVVLTLVTGTIFLMWLGEQITENGIGNGISLIIFAGIVSSIPRTIVSTLEKIRQGEIHVLSILVLLALFFIVVFFVVYMEMAQRKILVNYAKRQQGRRMYSAQSTYLPLKINMAGVIPPIFASSVILFPITLLQWFDFNYTNDFFSSLKLLLYPGKPLYIAFFGCAIIFFCFFYNGLVFNPKDTADNLKKSGGFIAGIRPGDQTASYINNIITRLTLIGAIYLSIVSLLPEFMILFVNIPFYFGGTSLLIIVVVIMDFIAQIQTRLISSKYDNLIKRSKLKVF